MAGWLSPTRVEIIASPPRSRLVNRRPARPEPECVWSSWRASVDLPQSIGPLKYTKSATGASCQTHASVSP